MEMTQEREGKILEEAIERLGTKEIVRLAGGGANYLKYQLSKKDNADMIRHGIANMSISLSMLELIYGDCVEEEIAILEKLEADNAG